MSVQFTEKFTVPSSSPYTYNLLNPTAATLVQVQSLAGVVVSGCSISSGVLTVPSGEAGAILIVVYNATPSSSYTGSKAQAGRLSSITISGTLIGEVKSISLNRGQWQDIDVTNFQSGLDKEIVTTIRNNGTVALKGNRVSSNSGQVAVEASYQNGTLLPYVQTLPINTAAGQTSQGDAYSFNAYVIKSDFSDEVTSAVEFDIELKISGAAPLTTGS